MCRCECHKGALGGPDTDQAPSQPRRAVSDNGEGEGGENNSQGTKRNAIQMAVPKSTAGSLECASLQALAVDPHQNVKSKRRRVDQQSAGISRDEVPPPPRVNDAPANQQESIGNIPQGNPGSRQCGVGRPNYRPGMQNGHFMLIYRRASIVWCLRCGAYVTGFRPSRALSL